MSGQLQGKTALITGGSAGLGRACAMRLAREGAQIILVARRQDKLNAVARELAPAKAQGFAADLADRDSLSRLCDRVLAEYPAIDILVNNAGVGLYAPSFEADPEQVRAMFDLNILAPIELTRRLLPTIPQGGSIVNVSSIGGKVPLPWLSLYSATKYALNAYSDGLRMELDGRGIQVLAVCPGYIDTHFSQNVLHGRVPDQVAGQRKFKITAAKCADEIFLGIVKGKRTVVTPKIGWLLVAAARLFPSVVYDRMAKMRFSGR